MFEQLAQFEGFQHTVELSVLVSAAQEKVVRWLLKWQPKKGRLFTWFSRCAKNAFKSELGKVTLYRKRHHVTSDNLEQFYGVQDHEVDKHDLARDFHQKLQQMTCRWGDPQEIAAIRYLADCILDDERDKQGAIRGATYACGIGPELAKFFYGWTIAALRHELYDHIHVPFTEQDLFRAALAYEHLPDMLDYVEWEKLKAMMVRFQGMRLKFPTLAYMSRLHESYAIHQAIDKSDLDPDAVAEIARKHKRTARSAQEIYNEMTAMLDPRRTGEYEVYDNYGDGN